MKDNRIVYGGGASEIACALAVNLAADKVFLPLSVLYILRFLLSIFLKRSAWIPVPLSGTVRYESVR